MSYPTPSSRSGQSNLELRVIQVGRDYNVNSGSGIFIVNNRTKVIKGARSIRVHIQGTEEEEEEYDQYFEYRRSDIRLLRKIHHGRVWDSKKGPLYPSNCERSVWLAEILSGDGKGSIVTVVSYQGQDAPEASTNLLWAFSVWIDCIEWDRYGRTPSSVIQDSCEFPTNRLPQAVAENISHLKPSSCADNTHLLGINRSKIPLLILLGELVPALIFADNIGFLSQWYLSTLHSRWGCKRQELWMDGARGVICRGPEGPYYYTRGKDFDLVDLEASTDLLNEDILMRYLATFKRKKIDRRLVEGISWNRDDPDDDVDAGMPEPVDQPTVVRMLTNSPIAVANQTWASMRSSLVERKLLGNEWLRFRLTKGDDGSLSLRLNHDAGEAWVSQALSFFHAHGIALDETLSDCNLVVPQATLEGEVSQSEFERQLRQKQSIYLFVSPPHPSWYSSSSYKYTSSFYWSFEESGGPPLSPAKCDGLGLPIELEFSGLSYSSMSWTTAQYNMLRQYKLLRGFNPITTDFARHAGFDECVFTPLNNSDRFEVVQEGSPAHHDSGTNTHELKTPMIVQQKANKDLNRSTSCDNDNIDVALVHVKSKLTTSYRGSNKRQTTGAEAGKERRRNDVEQDLHHNDIISIRQTGPGQFANQQPNSLFHVPSNLSSIDISFTTPTSLSHGIPQHVMAATFNDPVSGCDSSAWNLEIVNFNSSPSTSTMDDRDSAYADPAVYIVDTSTPSTSIMNNTDSAYADPSIYIIPTTFDHCRSETVVSPSMRPHHSHANDLNSRPVEDMSQRIENALDHQSCPSEKEHENLPHSRQPRLHSPTSVCYKLAEKKGPVKPTEPVQYTLAYFAGLFCELCPTCTAQGFSPSKRALPNSLQIQI
ncbi:hypothetical protein PM082_023726 [Marasmius tenuissimus]|nr:hypothetical protein PM082_023726 [Marasmius tenuissimus]